MSCPFCERETLFETPYWRAIEDYYPVTEGHILLIPHRHVKYFYELNTPELNSLGEIISQGQFYITFDLGHDVDFTVGINDGKYAGQTVDHLHIHIIPRRLGDTKHPEGGVRGVIPEKRKYQT